MAKIERFEDLQVWQKARESVKLVYQISLKEKFDKDFSLKDQANRSAGSITDNIAEGFERDGKQKSTELRGSKYVKEPQADYGVQSNYNFEL